MSIRFSLPIKHIHSRRVFAPYSPADIIIEKHTAKTCWSSFAWYPIRRIGGNEFQHGNKHGVHKSAETLSPVHCSHTYNLLFKRALGLEFHIRCPQSQCTRVSLWWRPRAMCCQVGDNKDEAHEHRKTMMGADLQHKPESKVNEKSPVIAHPCHRLSDSLSTRWWRALDGRLINWKTLINYRDDVSKHRAPCLGRVPNIFPPTCEHNMQFNTKIRS